VLGQHFLGVEDAILAQLALGYRALFLFKQVREDAGVAGGDIGGLIGYHEFNRQPIGLALQAALLDHATNANDLVFIYHFVTKTYPLVVNDFFVDDFAGAEEIGDVALQGAVDQQIGKPHTHQG
jgi:hypothetical protein